MTDALNTIELETPSDPIYLRSWVRVPVRLPEFSDPSFDDLLFFVEPADVGCGVSHSRDSTFDLVEPHVVLFTGSLPGEFTMRAIDKRTQAEVATAQFQVDYGWSGAAGPPLRVIGSTQDAPVLFDVLGSRNVAVVILETTDVDPLLEVEAEVIRLNFQSEIFDGVSVSGQTESSAAYLAEVSGNRFSIVNAGVVGPLRLTKSWDEIGPAWDDTRKIWKGVLPFSDAGVAEILTRNKELADLGEPPLIDLMTVESIIFVVRAFDGPDPSKKHEIWPWATEDGVLRASYDVDGDPTTPERLIESIVMPDNWPSSTADPGGRIRYTAAHELCHNIALSDQYTWSGIDAAYADRDVTEWTLMSNERKFPNLSVPERRKLGWLDAGAVTKVQARPGGAATDVPVNLRLSSQRPRPGEFTAVEIVLSDSNSYFLELRGKSAGAIADRAHTPQLLGTDWTDTRTGRPNLLRMRNDEDGDRGTYLAGQDYDESTTAKPQYPVDLKVTVLDLTATTARVRIQFGDRKPDPALTPFSAETRWQSPDIEVINDRNQASLDLHNVPWAGHPNRVIARVRNDGNLRAPKVRVEYYWADFTLSPHPEFTFFSADEQDVPAGGAPVEFDGFWTPDAGSKHICVKAEVTPYVDPSDPSKVEINPANNVAQSNYTRFISTTASPASRESVKVAVWGDPRIERQHVNVRQSSPFARTFVDHRWVDVKPGHRRDVTVFTEFMVGDESVEDYVASLGGIEEAFTTPNQLDLSSVIEDGCSGLLLGGAAVTVPVALRTRFTNFGLEPPDGSFAFGSVSAGDATVLVTVQSEDAPDDQKVFTTALHNGRFGVKTEHGLSGRVSFQAHYLGAKGWADCDSELLTKYL